MSENTKNKNTDNIIVDGQKISTAVQTLIEKGNERLFIIRGKEGNEIVSLPLTAAVVVGAIGVFFVLPVTIGLAILAYIMRVRFEIVRFTNENQDTIVFSDRKSKNEDN